MEKGRKFEAGTALNNRPIGKGLNMNNKELKTDMELVTWAASAALTPAVIAINTLIDTIPRQCVYEVDGIPCDKVLKGIEVNIKNVIQALQAAY